MATYERHMLILTEVGSEDIEVSVKDDNTVFFGPDDFHGQWYFQLSKKDWEELKKFVDDRL